MDSAWKKSATPAAWQISLHFISRDRSRPDMQLPEDTVTCSEHGRDSREMRAPYYDRGPLEIDTIQRIDRAVDRRSTLFRCLAGAMLSLRTEYRRPCRCCARRLRPPRRGAARRQRDRPIRNRRRQNHPTRNCRHRRYGRPAWSDWN
jgi:hypothetical protein